MTKTTKRCFTLIELLVVITVIALLMTILLPALGRARLQAKKARVASQITGISIALHAFANDQGDFPTSDPFPDGGPFDPCVFPTGAHLLALALVGTPAGELFLGNRKPYMAADKANVAPDNDPAKPGGAFPAINNWGGRGAYLLRDVSFGFPILYYRANRRARYIADLTQYACTGLQRGSRPEAVYYLSDNGMITGSPAAFGPFSGALAGYPAGAHPIFRQPQAQRAIKSFADYVEIEGTRQGDPGTPNENCNQLTARAQNAEEFLLVAAGPDGAFGPAPIGGRAIPGACDDIANFRVPTTGPPCPT